MTEPESIKKIPLTQGKFVIVDADDYEFLSRMKWRFGGRGYAVRTENLPKYNGRPRTRTILMHRVINQTPDGFQTDHINGNRLDNRKSNLRTVTVSQNQKNLNKRKGLLSSKYKGVSWNKRCKKWRAYIQADGKLMHLGLFTSETKAALAYNSAAIKYHGDFAKLNHI